MSNKTAHAKRITEFMQNAGQALPLHPLIPEKEVLLLRAKLIIEEALETVLALGVDLSVRYTGVGANGQVPICSRTIRFGINPTRKPNLVEIADGCADISVVTIGTLLACGIEDKPLLEEVDRSNLDKFRGDAHRGENGKWIKPSDWQPPNIQGVLNVQMPDRETI